MQRKSLPSTRNSLLDRAGLRFDGRAGWSHKYTMLTIPRFIEHLNYFFTFDVPLCICVTGIMLLALLLMRCNETLVCIDVSLVISYEWSCHRYYNLRDGKCRLTGSLNNILDIHLLTSFIAQVCIEFASVVRGLVASWYAYFCLRPIITLVWIAANRITTDIYVTHKFSLTHSLLCKYLTVRYILFIILFCDLLFSEKPAGNILKTFQDKQERHFPTFLYTEFTITDETDDNFLTILDAKLFI